MEQQILEQKPKTGHYQADACVVWCIDDRFSSVLLELVGKGKFGNYDLIKVAGGAKALASGVAESERAFLLSQIKTSLRLHHSKKIVLMNHSDCGAYGGLSAFGNDQKKEREALTQDLQKAKEFLKKELGEGIEIELVFVDFESIWRI